MNRSKGAIAFVASALLTIGILAVTVGKPPFMKHKAKHCERMEQSK